MKLFKMALMAGAVVALSNGAANAVVISGGTASITATATDYNAILGSLNLFNSTLGNLTQVTFSTTFGFTSTVTVTATTTASGSVKTESASNFQSTNNAITTVLNSIVNTIPDAAIGNYDLVPAAYDVTGTNNRYSVAGGTSQSFASNAADTSKSVFTVSANDLAAFKSATGGTFNVYGNTLTGTTGTTSGGNATISQVTYADQAISVFYTYDPAVVTPVPEPASLALLGAGLIGAGFIRRARKA